MFQRLKVNRELEDEALNTIFFEDGEYEGRSVRVSKTNYLAFLSMRGNKVSEEIDKLIALLDGFPREQIELDLIHLFHAVNWRFHNIACAFVALGFHSQKVVAALWERIEAGSWVSPQLVATAYFIDENFEDRAIELFNSEATYYKSIVSIAAILDSQCEIETVSECSRANLEKAKEFDTDDSGNISLRWLGSLRETIS
ncbi:hypothetical protein [Microbulbifer rhizosphaerae]|uniref:Uncharacterized protein n=1 Tax=Microbulbifer rhizosphaerae TaxID=1562603 RepID=A0A7W4WCS2_9GAMM|nr:hypothetical protein [Microbulbifer rhizosphaerae]MBB3061764.1 hypothetical protein [Microbulbifer rhizosphaerae]